MFFEEIFGNCQGYLCIYVISGGSHSEEFFEYPSEVHLAQELIRGNATKRGVNIYFYPVLFKSEVSELKIDGKDNIAFAPVRSADLNMTSPVLVSPSPDIIVESSRGRYQVYWVDQSENGNGGSTAPTSVNGAVECDTRLRRVPLTYNWKYHGEPWKVKILNRESLDTCDKVRKRYDLFGDQFDLLFRSSDRWSLARICSRLGASALEVFLVLQASQKENGSSLSIGTLYREAVNAVAACKVPSLLSDEELHSRTRSIGSGSSFVEKYVSWATTCTDSPPQYHVAGALTILSSLLCPHLRLGTSFGSFRPNLWFMILAGTTTTRKTTSMNLAVNLLEEVHNDPILSTDGTPEGTVSELSDRDGRSSLFYRDEIAGFIEAMVKKDYLAGMMEALTGLYDGGKIKRTLRRQTIEVKDPNLVILAGGIRSKMSEILNEKHISSGFIPRFLIVSGWTDVEDMKPIGPPVDSSNAIREKLVADLTKLYKYFSNRPAVREIDGSNIFASSSSKAKLVHLKATNEAWERIRRLEIDVRDLGISSDSPDIFGPIYERMMNSIIKVAMLIAADRTVRENRDGVLIELGDIVTAISYSDIWIESVYELASGIDDKPTEDERRVESVERYILRAGEAARSDIMRRFRLGARQMTEIEATLIQRGSITNTKVDGKKTVYRPMTE